MHVIEIHDAFGYTHIVMELLVITQAFMEFIVINSKIEYGLWVYGSLFACFSFHSMWNGNTKS